MSQHSETPLENRRPLKVRQAGFAAACARWLTAKNITPNQISVASVGFAALAAISLLLMPHLESARWLAAIAAALFIQCRLLCNLFDGMVAVEGGKSTPAGELFNDIPDRVADPLIIVAGGIAIAHMPFAVSLGWCAGLLAVMTAYVRTLSSSIDAPVSFKGPMAKQHRMAVMTVACIATAFEGWFWSYGISLYAALWIIVLGCVITVVRRSIDAYQFLEGNTPAEGGN